MVIHINWNWNAVSISIFLLSFELLMEYDFPIVESLSLSLARQVLTREEKVSIMIELYEKKNNFGL